MSYIEINELYKSFGKTEVLKGVSLRVEKGEILTVIGSSGSGKTTLLRCINFLEEADAGVMTLDNEVLLDTNVKRNLSDNELRKHRLNFGLVFQSFNLFPQYNVLKNVMLAPSLLLNDKIKLLRQELKAKGLSFLAVKKQISEYKAQQKAIIEKDAEELLKKVGLTDKKLSYPCELSGGQCQRVAIARALALKPKVLCFDEPTSALDPELTGEVLKVIKSLKSQDRTMIIVTHEMGFAKNVSDKVVFMKDGEIEEQGTPEQIFNNPKSPALQAFLSSVSEKEDI